MTTTSPTSPIGTDQDARISDPTTAPGPTPRDTDRARDAALVARLRRGDPDAFGLLYDAWFDRVMHLTERIVRDHAVAAEVSQDAFLSAWEHLDRLDDPASFGGWLLRIARNAALNRSQREARSVALDAAGMAVIERTGASPASAPSGFGVEDRASRLDDPAEVAGDAELVGLVHEAATALSERDAEVLDLQLRYQLTPAEVGDVLGLNRNAANQLCHRVRNHFATAFAARMLWRSGAPQCPELAAELDAAGITDFGAGAVRAVSGHLDRCPGCDDRRRTRLAPSALFGALGVAPVLVTTRVRVAHALAAQGVPMGHSATLTAPHVEGTAASGASTQPVTAAANQTTRTSSRTRDTTPTRAARRALLALGIAATLVLVVALLAWRGSSSDSPSVRATGAGAASSTSKAAGLDPSSVVGAGGPQGGTAGDPTTAPRPTSPRPTDEGGGPPAVATSTTTAPTTLPGPSVERFELTPSTPQPSVFATTTGPVLSWSVRGPAQVTIRRHYDDGSHGEVDQGVVYTGRSGSVAVCPGSPVAGSPDACTAPAGTYSFELVMTTPDGSSVSAPSRPGFEVLAPIIL